MGAGATRNRLVTRPCGWRNANEREWPRRGCGLRCHARRRGDKPRRAVARFASACGVADPQERTNWRFASPCGIWVPQERTNGRFVSICGIDVRRGLPHTRPTCGDACGRHRWWAANAAGAYILAICIQLRHPRPAGACKLPVCIDMRHRRARRIFAHAIYLRRCVRAAPLVGGQCRRGVHLGNLYPAAASKTRRSVQPASLYRAAESATRRSVQPASLYRAAESATRRSVQTGGLYPYAEPMWGLGSLARDLPAAM
jgi:hypothetical protein